jgi:hypothetical protein
MHPDSDGKTWAQLPVTPDHDLRACRGAAPSTRHGRARSATGEGANRGCCQCENQPVDGELAAAVARLREAFARYPHPTVLDGCPHCRGPVQVDDQDLFSLTISLGNTVGDRDDVKSLLPVLLKLLITSTELWPDIVLAKLPHEQWRSWPAAEQAAVDGYLDAVWRSLLAEYPSRVRSFDDTSTFLDAILAANEDADRFLDIWDVTSGPAADRHLAEIVNSLNFAARRPRTLDTWLYRETVRDRLLRAFDRDHDRPWADDLARAYDLICGGRERPPTRQIRTIHCG